MAEQFTFPQSGDRDDAEHFGSMIGQDNLSNYVETGLNFTVNYTVPEVSVSTGKAFIQVSSDTASSSGDTILKVNRAVQNDAETVALTDNDVNYIYLQPDFGTDDNANIEVFTSTQTGDRLLLGTVDTSNDTSEELNRNPSISTDLLSLSDDNQIEFGDNADFGQFYDSSLDELVIKDLVNDTVKITFDKSGDVNIPNGDITDGASVIYDSSLGEIPDSILGSIDNSTLTNSSITVAGNSVSLGGSTGVNYVDLTDTGNSFPIPNSDISNTSVTINTGTGLINGGSVSLGGSITIDHGDTSTQSNVSAPAGGAIADIDLDGSGHVTNINTVDFDSRFDNYQSWTIQEGNGTETNEVVSGETLTISGGTDMETELDTNGNLSVIHSNTSAQGNITTSGSTVVNNIDVDGRGHVTTIGTETRSLDSWDNPNANIDFDGNSSVDLNSVEFRDADADGNNWKIEENGTNGRLGWSSVGAGGLKMDLEHNGNLRITGEITENASL